MQSVSSRIWTRAAVSISCDDNHYTMGSPYNNFNNSWEQEDNDLKFGQKPYLGYWQEVRLMCTGITDRKFACNLTGVLHLSQK